MASGRKKRPLQSENNRSMFEFVTRNDNEGDAEKISNSILSDIVSTLVDKAENASSQRHHASADQKTFESWKLNPRG